MVKQVFNKKFSFSQETRCPLDKLPNLDLPGYHLYCKPGENKKGYAGVAIYTKKMVRNIEYSIGLQEFDEEGILKLIKFIYLYKHAVENKR